LMYKINPKCIIVVSRCVPHVDWWHLQLQLADMPNTHAIDTPSLPVSTTLREYGHQYMVHACPT
jgi:hypothetical protein